MAREVVYKAPESQFTESVKNEPLDIIKRNVGLAPYQRIFSPTGRAGASASRFYTVPQGKRFLMYSINVFSNDFAGVGDVGFLSVYNKDYTVLKYSIVLINYYQPSFSINLQNNPLILNSDESLLLGTVTAGESAQACILGYEVDSF